MKAILKPFFALCGLVALSTALSADSRLFPVGGGGAGWGEPGFLYSDYLQTAAASGREVEFQGSFVLDNRRPFLAELGTAFPGRVVDEVKSLPLREWGLGYVFEKRRPAHQRALLERGWRLADWLAEETLMAATESSRGGGLIRTLEFDLQSELGGRRAQVGLNVLGALRESNDEAIAWQFRGFKSSGGLGGNTGLIWRRAVANDRALAGANVFLDYETYADENFWRGSAGAELRSAWADVFGNVYRGFSDDVKKNNRTTYTADGYDVELNVHSPELPWLVGEVAYYNFEGKAGDKDEDGVRFGLRFNPLTDLELGVEYDNGDSDDDGKKKWAARIRYSGEFGGVLKAQYRPSTNSGNFEPRDWFFAPVEREYSQRIRKSGDSGSIVPEFTFSADATKLAAILPIKLEGAGLDLTVDDSSGAVAAMGMIDGVQISPRPLRREAGATAGEYTYFFPIGAALRGTVTVTHKTGNKLTFNFPRSGANVVIGSTVAISAEGFDYFALLNGNADILLGSGGGMLVAEQRLTMTTAGDYYRRFTVFANAAPSITLTLGLTVTEPTGNEAVDSDVHLPLPQKRPVSVRVEQVIGNTTTNIDLELLRASVVLANDNALDSAASPPSYYRGEGLTSAVVVGTFGATGGSDAPYTWSKTAGQLDVDSNSGVITIPDGTSPATGVGRTLTVQVMLNDNPSDSGGIGAETPALAVGFTVVYREIEPLALVSYDPDTVRTAYGLLGESNPRRNVEDITATGEQAVITWSRVAGELNVESASENGKMGRVFIPAGVAPAATPGARLTVSARLTQPVVGAVTSEESFVMTVRYIGVNRISAPAFAAATDKAIAVNSPTSYQVTALTGDRTAMDIATLGEASGGGDGVKTYAKVGEPSEGLSFNSTSRKVSIPADTPPTGQRLGLTVRITDSGAGSDVTPPVTVMLTVQYVSVNEINLDFNDGDVNPNDGLVTVFGLQGHDQGQNNVARVVFGGGFGGVTVVKTGGDLVLEGNTTGARINIPAAANITPQPDPGRPLLLMVSANEPPANDPRGITDAKTATMTLQYVQVNQLEGAYYPVDSNGNGQVQSGAAAINGIHTVGMATQTNNQFTVASLSVSGGVGNYSYSKAGGGNELVLDSTTPGQILMRGGIIPVAPETERNFEIVIAVNDRGTNDNLTPAFMLTLTVSYNTIVPIVARFEDTRTGATPANIPHTGGRVYFLKGAPDTNAKFGRLVVSGGFPATPGDYTIVQSNASGIAYNDQSGELSMTKCSGGAKSIRFAINDGTGGNADLTDELVVNFAVTSGADECLDPIAAQLRNAANDAAATSPLEIFGVEGKTEATVVAAWMATGGGGDLNWTPSGDLRLVAGNDNKVRQVQIPAGTSPEASPGNPLSVTVVVNDENDKGGFLTEPLTVEAKVNYVEVASVRLALNDDDDNAITSPVNVYGVESVAKAADKRKVANIAATGGAGGALALSFQTSGDGATTADSFEIVGNNAVNITKAFPAFGASELATVAVVASDSGANSGATPDVTVRATVRLLPVLAAVEEGGNIVEIGNADNVVAPTSPSATEANFTVYVLANAPHTIPIAQVSAASVTRNAGVAGASGLRVQAPTRHGDSTPEASGLTMSGTGDSRLIRISPGATAISGGADLKLVLEYEDEGFDAVADLTAPRRKTVNVHYELVTPFTVQFRTPDDVTLIPDNDAVVTSYVAAGATEEVRVARLNQIGGADGMDIVSQSGDLMAKKIGDVFYAVVTANTGIGNTLHLTVMMDDAPGAADNSPERAQGSQTPPVELRLTVAYLETQDVVAQLADIAGNDHFLGAADSTSGVRTLYFKDGATRPAQLDILRINAQSGTGDYTFEGGTPDGFALNDGTSQNNKVLALLQAKADGATALATVKIDDTGDGADISEPATLTVSVAVKDVSAIAAELIVPANVPGVGPGAGTTLGGLYVRSAAAAESSSVYIASVVARGGVEEFTYTRQSESSAELLLNDDGQVHLAQNYTPDGNNTLSILIAVNDTGDGSTLTEAAMMTLQFVLAETIKATAFLRSNGGAYLPSGSGDNVAVGSDPLTVRVKTDDYDDEQVLFGVSGSGGLGNMGYAIERVAGTNENGLVARGQQAGGQRNYDVEVVVESGASSAPQTLGITAVVNESTADPNNFTPGATISLTVVYDDVEPITAAFNDTDGNAISGVHVVVRDTGTSTEAVHVGNLAASDGVGDEGGTNSYTYTQSGTGNLLINPQGRVEVAANVEPKLTDNDLVATVVIDDRGNWAHISEPLTKTITVRYSSKLVLVADIRDTRQNAVPSVIPITEEDGAPARIYFDKAGADAGQVLAQLAFRGGKAGSTYSAAASQQTGLTYDDTTKQISMTKCTDTPNALKSIRLVVNDAPDDDNVSDPLTLDITVRSGVAECIEPINAQARTIGSPNGQAITEDLTAYALAGVTSTAVSVVATVFVEKGAGEYTSTSSGGNVLALVGDGKGLLTVQIPVGAVPGAAPNGTELNIDIRINDEDDKGGFLTDEAQVEITVNYIAVQPHGQFTAQKAADVLGEVSSGVLTVRRVAQQSGTINILTNIRGANAAEERILPMGGSSGIRFQADPENAGAGKLVVEENQNPDGAVRIITLRVEDYKPIGDTADDRAQFAARPDRLFTISVRYEGELEGAAYDSENTANEITAPVNRYVEQGDSNVSVAVASLSVRGGTPDYSYSLTGDLELNADNTTVQIKASANPADPATPLTARIVIDDTGRTDTAPLTVELTANYILIDGHSNLVVRPDGGQLADLNSDTVYPLIVGAQSSSDRAALRDVDFKTALSGAALTRVDSASDAELLFDATSKEVRVAGGTALNGQTVSVVLRGSDGEGTAQAKARNDRLYTVQVRYLQELSAKAKVTVADGVDPKTGADYGDNAREIRVATGTTAEQNVAYIDIVGGTGGYQLAIDTTGDDADSFELDGQTLKIKAGVVPGALPNGNELTAFVKVDDDESKVGGPDTGELNIEVRVNYIALPEVEGSFVEGRDGEQKVSDSLPVTVYSAFSGGNAPATVAATAKATVTGTENTFTFHKVGDGGKLVVDENSGAVMLQPNRPSGGNFDIHVITVLFSAAANAVSSQQTLTVRHQMIRPIISGQRGIQSLPECHPGNQINGDGGQNATQITVPLWVREEGYQYRPSGRCNTYFAFAQKNATAGGTGGLTYTTRDADGLVVRDGGNEIQVGVVNGQYDYTAETNTLSIVIVYSDVGPGSHVTDDFLRTVYLVLPGVPKLEAVLEDASGADAEITKPLTLIVAGSGNPVVASVKASGGETGNYDYTGAALEGTGELEVNAQGKILVPSSIEPVVRPGTTYKYEVSVDDTGGDDARRNATGTRKVTLTLQYIKSSGPLAAAAVIETSPIADTANTTFYGEASKALTTPINVADIAPTGGIPPYNYEVEGDNTAAGHLGISGTSGNNIKVQITVGDTPGAASGTAADRIVTVKVSDTGDTANSVAPTERTLIIRAKFVEVAPHGALKVPDPDSPADLGTDFVVVRPASETEIVKIGDTVDETTTPSNPTFKLTLIAANGLLFNGEDAILEIAATSNPPTGQLLTAELRGSDGEATPQAAARLDKLYTISVRYVPEIEAEVLSTTDATLSNTDVVELTVAAGTQLVGKVSASGGVGGIYSYTPTPAENGGTNLAVDADGNINIIAGTIPVAGDGLSITVNIAVDDDSASADADRDETSAANVQIRVKYVLLEDLALTAKDLQGNDVGTGATDTVGTFYLLEGQTTGAQVLVATVTASGGIKDYEYALEGTGGDLAFDPATRAVHIKSGQAAAAPDSAGATLAVTVKATDSQTTANEKLLTVRAVFETVQTHGDLIVINGGSTLGINLVSVVTAADSNARVVADNVRPTRGETGVKIVQVSTFGLEYVGTNLQIAANAIPDGRTLSVLLMATDEGDEDNLADKAGARPDQLYTVQLRYIRALAAVARNADGTAVLNAPVVITSKATTHIIASISVSGGTSNTYTYTGESTAGPALVVNASTGIVSIPAGVQPQVGGVNIIFRVTANDTGTNDDATDPASALVTVIYHLLESPEIEAQDKDGTAALAAPVNVYQLSGVDLAANVPVAKVVGSKGTSPYTFAIFGTNANGMEVDANTGNIVLKSGESTTATGSAADRVITVRLTDSQTNRETADATITVRFEAVAPHGDLTFIAETGVTRNTDSEYVVVQAGTPSAAVPVLNFASVDSVSRTAGDAPLVFVSGSPNRLEIAANTVPTGQTITAEITQTDGDNNDLERTRPDRTYTVSVRYIPALAAEVRNANGVGALVLTDGTLVIEKESAASLNIASIAVSGGTSDTYTYSIDNKHTDNELEVSNDGIVYIPASVAPLPTDGLSLTVEISANDSGDNNTATPAAVATIAVRYVMDPGLGGQVQVAADNTPATSPTVIYRLVNDAAPSEGLDTGLKVVGLRGDTNAYTYANAGNTNPDGLGVDENTGVISILSGQTPDSNQSKVRLLTVKISGVRNGNPREALVTVSVQFLGVGRFGNLQIDNAGAGDAPTNSEGEYVVVRDVSSTGQVIVINSFGIARSDSVVKSAGAPELEVSEVGGGNQLRIKSGTVPGGQPPVSGGLTLVAQIKASDDDSDAQDLARPDNDNYFLTVIYLANIAPTLEDAGGTAFPDLTDVDISGPTGGASLFVGNIAATGGDTGESGRYTYNKASGDLELDTTNGQVFISGKTPTAGEGEPLFIEVDVNDTGGDNSDQTDAKRIRIDVDYILDPGLSGQVQNLDGTEATSTPIIYRLAGNAAPSPQGLATGLKVAGQRGDAGYTYAIEGTDPNPDGLSVDASSGVISIVASQTPDSDANKVRLLTVKISGNRNGSPSEALVTVSVIFRAVNEISGDGFQIQSNNRCSIPRIGGSTFQRNVLPLAEEGTEYSHTTACQFFTLIDESRGSFGFRGGSGGFDKRVVGTPNGLRVDQRGTDLRIQLSSQPVLYTAERLTLDIVIAYNDNGPAKDLTAEHRKTIEIVLPGVPSVDAVLNDEGGNAIADIAAIEKRGPGNLSVFVGNIVASGGDGNLAIVKDATDGGDLGIDNNGQVYIPDSVQPAAGAGNQLHLLVNINDDGANSGLTKQKQLRIEVDYILQLGLAGQTQDLEDNNVSGEHVVYRQAGVAVPTEGLTVVKVVGERGTSPYTYAVEGDASGSKLVLHTASGSVAIAANETASDQLLELTVRISDNASPPATALHTVSIRFNSVAPHADLTRELAAGVTQNSAGEYVVAQDGAQTQSFQVLTKIKSDEGAAVNRIGTDPIELRYVFNTFSDEGNLKIGGNTVPTGQTLSFQVVATDGNGEDSDSAEVKAQKTARQDRTFDIAVRYLSHLQTPTLQDRNDADIDLSSAVLVTAAGGASVYVGDIAASGGTGEYTFGKDATTGGLTVSPAGQVYLRSDAVPTSEGAAFAITVNVNDSGKDNEVTNGTAIEITVNYILQATGPALPRYNGDLTVLRDKGAGGLGRNRICPFNTLCEEIVGIITPEIVTHDRRLTVFGFNTDTAPVFIFTAAFSVPAVITEASGSHFSVGAGGNSPFGIRYPVMLKTENLHKWGQELEARLRVRDPENTLEQLVTVTMLLAERVPPASLTVGITSASNHGNTPGSRTNTNANRPMQWLNPNDVGPTDTPPGFQAVADFPGMTVTDVEVVRVRVSSLVGNPPDISTWGDFQWDEEAKIVRRNGIRPAGSDPFYDVWVRGKDPNPKMVPTPLSFRLRYRGVSPLAWQTTPPSTIAPSGVTSFEVKGGAQARNYSPLRDMVAEVNAPFVISNMRISRAGSNDWRFLFDVGLSSGASAGAHTANIVVRDRGYTSFGTLTHTATATK